MKQRLLTEMAKFHLAAPKNRKTPTSLVFAFTDGRRLGETFIKTTLASAVASCKTIAVALKPKVTMHCLRHTVASQLVAGGPPIFDVAHMLGHKDVRTTQRYAHFQPKAGVAAAETLEKMLDLDRVDDETDAVHDREAADGIG